MGSRSGAIIKMDSKSWNFYYLEELFEIKFSYAISFMRNSFKHIAAIAGATLLFLTFTMLHEYDWLIPPSPVNTVASATTVPLPDVIEEHGSEDEIEHDEFLGEIIPLQKKSHPFSMVYRDSYIPNIATPPPDKV